MVARPTKDEMFMQLAQVVAQRSTCLRAKVGCIITNMDGTSIVSMGYNGNARGLRNYCDDVTPGACGCLHAEENALFKPPYGTDLTMYTLTSPCLACAKRIRHSSVRAVWSQAEYRDTHGLQLL
jgi:dCMP deaminase